MLAGDHDVDVVAAAQAMIHHRQETIGIGRQIDAHDLGLLVDDVVDEARILMRESIVVLAPDVRAQQIVQRGDLAPPRQARGHLQPFGVLIEHRIDDVNEGFVAVEQAVPPGQQVSLEPALALVLAQHLHHPALAVPGNRRRESSAPPIAGSSTSNTASRPFDRSRRGRRCGNSAARHSCFTTSRKIRGRARGSRRCPGVPGLGTSTA